MFLLEKIETLGNKLPHPTLLFIALCPVVMIVSAIASALDLTATHPITNTVVAATSLISTEGLHKILTNTISNFTQFAPVGSVLIAMLGVGIAEKSGLIGALLRLLVLTAPKNWITFMVVVAGVLSSLAADAGYVVLIPIAALVFMAAGKHPVAGITAAFAGVSGGYSANLIIGPVDAILAGITTEAARIVDPSYTVEPTANFYFIIGSTLIIGILGTLATNRIIIPYLGPYKPVDKSTNSSEQTPSSDQDLSNKSLNLSSLEKSSLIKAAIAMGLIGILVLWGLIPNDGVLRDPNTGSITRSPFISGIVTIIAFIAAIGGIVYGRYIGTFKSNKSIIEAMEETMSSMAGYLVLMFFAAQFVNYFNWTNLGVIFAINGSASLQTLDLNPIVLVCIFIFMAAFINLFIGSASAKWAILAPVFVPMLLLLGIAPELTQAAYRIGDSSSNIITPLMPYFALVVAFVEKYDTNVGIGTVIALMLPYSVIFLIGWTVFIAIWLILGIPLGPDTQLFVTP